jgi:hypothetical protein
MTPASLPSEYEVEVGRPSECEVEVGYMFELAVMVRDGALAEVLQVEDPRLREPWG